MSNPFVVVSLSVGDVSISAHCRRRWTKNPPIELTEDVEKVKQQLFDEIVEHLRVDINEKIPGLVRGLQRKLIEDEKKLGNEALVPTEADSTEHEAIELPIGDIKIKFLEGRGPLRSHQFEVEGPGIDPLRVRSLEIPKLDYGCSDVLTVKVEMYPTDMSLQIPQVDVDVQQINPGAVPQEGRDNAVGESEEQ
jgi:hypothetical protein